MRQQNIFLLGSTGSIGTQTLSVARSHPERLRIFGLSAHRNWKLLAEQIRLFRPEVAVLTDAIYEDALREAIQGVPVTLFFGAESLDGLMGDAAIDTVLNSMVGFSGFKPTCAALKHGKRVALANKESLVVGGELIKNHIDCENPILFPVDSEHSAIQQCLIGESPDTIEELIITASGGPFRDYSVEDLSGVTVEKALKHPNWDMGAKITIDSATMMNKGLEIIEAYWLFGLPLDKIRAVIHPQSIIHSMITFQDGSVKAQLGLPDMRVPIQYALSYPDRWPAEVPRIDWSQSHTWTFRPVDMQLYPCFRLALESIQSGGYAPVVLNASNEVAVQRFLDKEIPYIGIAKIVEKSLEHVTSQSPLSVDTITQVDRLARNFATELTI